VKGFEFRILSIGLRVHGLTVVHVAGASGGAEQGYEGVDFAGISFRSSHVVVVAAAIFAAAAAGRRGRALLLGGGVQVRARGVGGGR
jgi:hypothetical protein